MPLTPEQQEFLEAVKAQIPSNLGDVCTRFPGFCDKIDAIESKLKPEQNETASNPEFHPFGGHSTLKEAIDCPNCNSLVKYDEQALAFAKEKGLLPKEELAENLSRDEVRELARKHKDWPPPGIEISWHEERKMRR